ncbi:MAG: DUF2203 family protein [Gemmatimonadota bacterium]|nr:DUF2203 family protein [Gemmatimonadota bacterium]
MNGAIRAAWTARDAERALPLVSRIAADIAETNARLADLLQALRTARAARVRARAAGRGRTEGGRRTGAAGGNLEALRVEVAAVSARLEELLSELAGLGCRAHGGDGGVDFPAVLDGEPVLLCWRPGEADVRWWHARGAGPRDRVPLPASALAEREA